MAAGEICTLTLEGMPVQGVVRWAFGDSVGITFKQKLLPRQLERVSQVTPARRGPQRARRRVWGYAEIRWRPAAAAPPAGIARRS